MNKKYIVSLTEDEQQRLIGIIGKRSPKSSVVLNAQILLAADINGPGMGDELIAGRYHVNAVRVQRVREKLVLHGIDIALHGFPMGPKSKTIKIDGDVEAHLAQLACSSPPEGYDKWTFRLLADKAVELNYVESISHEGVRQVLKKTKSSPGSKKCG